MNPKILSLGYALPLFSYSQEEVFRELGYPKHFWRIYRDAQIEKRHFAVRIEQLKRLTFQEQQEEYPNHATELAKQALLRALDGKSPQELGLLTYSTCTGFPPGPTVGTRLAQQLTLRSDIEINNLSSQGCEAAFPGLRRCYDYVARWGGMAAAIACELCSLTYYPEPEGNPDPTNDYELLRSNAIFADGCSCAIIGYDDNPRHPEIIDAVPNLDTTYIEKLGYVWQNGRLRVRLDRDVPVIAVSLLNTAVDQLLRRNSLTIEQVRYWVIHPPGAAVLDLLRDTLRIPEEKLKYSRKALRLFGNCSSSTVGIVGKLLMEEEQDPQGYLVMANVGPGMVANASLMKFGE